MATFAEELESPNDRTDSYLSASKGYDTPDARKYSQAGGLAGALDAIGNLIPLAADTGYKAVDTHVQKTFYEANDQTNADFGVDLTGQAAREAVVDAATPSLLEAPINIPAEITRSFEDLKIGKKAADHGKISPSQWDARIQAAAKKLYARYQTPHMRSLIRQRMVEITGLNPDQDLRERFMKEAEEKAKNSVIQQDKVLTEIDEGYKLGIPEAIMIDKLGPQENWSSLSRADVIARLGPIKSQYKQLDVEKALLDQELSKLNLSDKERKEKKELYKDLLTSTISTKYAQQFHTGIKPIADQIDAMGPEGFKDPKKKQALLNVLYQEKRRLQSMASEEIMGVTGRGISFDESDRKDIIANSSVILDSYISGVENEDTNALQALKTMLDRKVTDVKASVLEDQRMVTFNAVNEVTKDANMAHWFMGKFNKNWLKEDNSWGMGALDAVLNPTSDVQTLIQKQKALGKPVSWPATRDVLRDQIELTKTFRETGSPVVGETLEKLYGPKMTNFFKNGVPQDQGQRAQMYAMFFSPAQKRVVEEEARSGNTQHLDNYLNSLENELPNAAYRHIELFSKAPVTQGAIVSFNDKTNTFKIESRTPRGVEYNTSADFQGLNTVVSTYLNNFPNSPEKRENVRVLLETYMPDSNPLKKKMLEVLTDEKENQEGQK